MILIKGNVERVTESQAQIIMLKQDGFKPVGGKDEEEAQAGGESAKSFTDMTVTDLRALAENVGIEGSASLTKKELLEVLKDVV